MNMENFDPEIWWMHRKLFHRYVKYSKYFRKATEALPEYQKAIAEAKSDPSVTGDKTQNEPTKVSPPVANIISLITSSSEEVSEDEVSELFDSTGSEPES